MPPWLMKAAVQGVLARLPEPQRWNRLLQRYVTRSLELDDATFVSKWQQCERHLSYFRELGRPGDGLCGARVVELGTGWFPLVPIGLVLLGADRVCTIDTQDLLDRDRVLATLRRYADAVSAGDVPARPDKLARLESALALSPSLDAAGILGVLGITSIVGDARATALESSSIDLFVSNNTFEHIPRPVLVDILREFARLAAPGALGSHWIDMGDHYGTFDPSITVFNFYRFPGWMWRLFNNELQYQNRLRVSDFRDVNAEAGWRVVLEEHKLGALEDLRRIRVAREFRERYSEDELRICAAWVLSVLRE
jgi:hypothetical protein